jgi:hypothetical protein
VSSSTAAVTAMAAQRNRLIRHFQKLAAFDEQSAISADTLPRAGFRLIDRLKDQRVIRTTPTGMLFLDQARWTETRSARRRNVLLLLVGALLVGIVVWALNTTGSAV